MAISPVAVHPFGHSAVRLADVASRSKKSVEQEHEASRARKSASGPTFIASPRRFLLRERPPAPYRDNPSAPASRSCRKHADLLPPDERYGSAGGSRICSATARYSVERYALSGGAHLTGFALPLDPYHLVSMSHHETPEGLLCSNRVAGSILAPGHARILVSQGSAIQRWKPGRHSRLFAYGRANPQALSPALQKAPS